ncbi:MAGUK p55 subfamily member 4-like [Salvelinus fontinalis]|uniref:MAGUK p55 subfamily member 4-like n=1 Tax=Salvelinus fontinalis TaxID=8038 RepID=UPI002485AFCF|nr:MAGUK p55 subfamily member 4-like [Salvelinus fontinalis]
MRQAVEAERVTSSPRPSDHGLRQILSDVVEEVKHSIRKEINGAELLNSLLNAPWLKSLLQVYECLRQHQREPPAPFLTYTTQLIRQILADLRTVRNTSAEARELYSLLRGPHFQALTSAHDTVAQKDYDPVLPPIPDNLADDEEAMRIVCLAKNKQQLGATIKRNEITGEIFVARVIHGGLADRNGDRITEVNGYSLDGLEPEQVIEILARSQGTLMFKVVSITDRPVNNQMILYVRVMADYSPQQDPAIPCAEAGLDFRKGDLLEIVDQSDTLWWQAKKLPSTSAPCAGLIPSTNLLRRKQKEFWWSQPYQPHTCITPCERVSSALTSRGSDWVQTYPASVSAAVPKHRLQSAVLLHPLLRQLLQCPQQPIRRGGTIPVQPAGQAPPGRPGPSGVRVNELRRRLIEINPVTFQGAVPHTTRAAKSHEESGKEYHFINRELFENIVHNNKFLENGEYKGHFYSTSLDAVKDVLNSGRICVIEIEPHAIQSARTHELKAYIIYVKPPTAERMKETRKEAQITTNYYVNIPFKEEDFQEIEEAARKMESHYCQFFDCEEGSGRATVGSCQLDMTHRGVLMRNEERRGHKRITNRAS